MPLGDLFKSKKQLDDEQAKEQKRELRAANRSCERIEADLDRQAKELETQIKRAAAKGDQTLAKTLAKQLIKVRNEKTRALGAKSKINAVSSHANSMKANQKLATIMGSTASTMGKVNQALNPQQLAHQMGQFQQEITKMDMKGETLEETFDDLFGNSDEEAEGDAIMNQVLDEIGVELNTKLTNAPTPTRTPLATTSGTKTGNEDDLLKRLDNLRTTN